ncbi:RHS repeat-associated core domain-containing protein [Methylosinus trichosporium]|uniref:Teneurin-like YD-shell domain-containing protein n=1 Tax=Methylosinus trichosporium (strain ATCC 35070 / NCIMB 11131 / UNIQEM 75 / OB3b) TaxID=595536 RepID=A0A2D2D7H3_METT3|nr:RHS repeat-associated core domain-containing protein [Methylosinus trichosporium]ATQ70957.1 hypothetical protein CQW49_23710 [Methylosinus trichosporium OB3b]
MFLKKQSSDRSGASLKRKQDKADGSTCRVISCISGGPVPAAFAYDANGNQTSGLGRTIGYTAADLPASVKQGTRTIGFAYDPERQRYKQTAPEGTTLYFEAFGVRAELLGSRWTQYLTVGGAMVGVRFDNVATGAVALRYFHLDHLGSVAVVTYAGGDVAERNSYDPWGKRRYSDGSDDPSGSLDSVASRGFTGQEHLTEVGLIHFNARLYDPLVGRFTSADSIVPHPGDPQSYNRYAYVRNRPLSATDPSGHYDLVALPPIDVGAPWSTFNWTSFVASGAANQAYLAAIYGRITGAAYYGASILPFPIGSQLQYQQYLSFLRIYGPQLRAAGFFMTRQPNLTPPPEHAPASTIAAGFATGSGAYAYTIGCGLPCARTVGSIFGGIGGGIVGVLVGAAVGGGEGFGLSAPTGAGVLVGTPAGALAGAVVGGYAGAQSGAAAGAALGEGVYTWFSENAATTARGGAYVLRDVEGTVVRSGRTNDLARREAEHLRDPNLAEYQFQPAYRTDVYAEQRGLEQILHDRYGPGFCREFLSQVGLGL